MDRNFSEADFVGFWKRVLITLLDGAILIIPALLLNRLSSSLADFWQSEIPLIIPWIFYLCFDVLLVSRFGGTPGRLILRTRIVNAEGNYPSLKQAVLRDCFYIVSSVLAIIVNLGEHPYTVISRNLSLWADQATVLNFILSWVIVIDSLFIVFTVRNRALHDMIAGTYVVYKSALDRSSEE
ncbi:RDD family protein [Paenibacillus monticola]|uniref:RDD domain-containing protein n=1 Tax=Paenibacillus monticola TaxID=2666075 RepID=A0A7X2H195_9BACL|nr:RDD family protein [Paenibacillus monticola]MRN51717.1 hypothetical protein [Paenibacillus monticola]